MNYRLAEMDDLPQILNIISKVVPIMNASGNRQWDEKYPNGTIYEQICCAEVLNNLVFFFNIRAIQNPVIEIYYFICV